ncbi:MAG: family 10 glycosylhydrolase [Candidatus Marinimicrobia bacterium]|nr:family 10 glycosylhydrolase [Candidatus Neomarinimicrobiota bacterium]
MISKKILSTFLFVTAVIALPLTAAEEMRGVLIFGSDWAAEEGKTGKARKITQIITVAADKGFNAVFFEVRSADGCFYPSGDEPWSTLLNEEDPGFDPLQHAIDESKRRGMQFHAQINVLQLDDPEMSLHHKTRKEWILRDADHQPLGDKEHYYLDPSSPEVIAYLKAQVRAVTAGYAVDGLHFTGIRYPGPALFGIPSFQGQYNATKSFTGLKAEEFAQHLLTSCLEALLTEARLMKPYLVFSAETGPLPYDMRGYGDLRPADTYYFQNGLEWLKTGLIDILVPRMHMPFRDRKTLYNEYFRNIDVAHRIVPAIYGGEENIRAAGIKRFVDHIRHKAGSGALICYASAAPAEDSFYEGPAACPHLAYTHANTQAVEIDLSAFPVPHDIIRVDGDDRFRIVDRNRKLSLSLPDLPRYLSIRSMDRRMRYNTRGWTVPYRYTAVSEKALERPEMFIELRRAPDHLSQDSSFSFLFRASEGKRGSTTALSSLIPIPVCFSARSLLLPAAGEPGSAVRLNMKICTDSMKICFSGIIRIPVHGMPCSPGASVHRVR